MINSFDHEQLRIVLEVETVPIFFFFAIRTGIYSGVFDLISCHL